MNNENKFDPMTGEPIANTVEPIQPENIEKQDIEPNPTVEPQNTVEQQPINTQAQIQTELQNIPTVDQNEQQFINNVQSINNKEKKEEILTALVGDKIDVKIDKSLAVESALNDMNTQSLYLLVKQEKAG